VWGDPEEAALLFDIYWGKKYLILSQLYCLLNQLRTEQALAVY
jgi:hypothetical protein